MFNTGEDIYLSFLEGIRRSNQSVVQRSKFVEIWNNWVLNQWVKDNIPEGYELTEKQIDDLQSLIVVTDGKYTYNGTVLYPISHNNNLFDIPSLSPVSYITDSGQEGSQVYPLYKSLKKVWFRFSASDWVNATPLKAISESFVRNSSYSAPTSKRFYFKLRSNKIEAIVGDGEGLRMKLEYLRYPNTMSIESGNIVYTIDLSQSILEEVRGMAVRIHLEKNSNPRYQSFLQEESIRKISQ